MTATGCCSRPASGAATAWTRNGKDWSDKFRALVKAAAKLPAGCLIDGEAVALDKKGKPSFQLLQSTLKERRREPRFLRLRPAGRPRRGHHASCPTSSARSGSQRCSKACIRRSSTATMSSASGEELFDAICKEGGEGIISKKADAPYRGERTRNWLKVKCIQRQEFVIIGWSESDKRRGFRSLLLGTRDGRKLTYAGKVGTGFDAETDRGADGADGAARDRQGRRSKCRAPSARARIGSSPSWSPKSPSPNSPSDGILRHPSFIALREDKPAKEVVPRSAAASDKRPAKKARPHDAPRASGSRSAIPTA